MKVKSLLMTKGKDVISLSSDSSVADAIRTMDTKKIGAVLVTDGVKTIGIFTERDVLKCYTKTDGKGFSDIKLADAMSKNLHSVDPNEEIREVMASMIDRNIRHVPVIKEGKAVGVLSLRDIIRSQVNKSASDLQISEDFVTKI